MPKSKPQEIRDEDMTKKQMNMLLLSQLKAERVSFEGHYQELADFVKPRGYKKILTDNSNKGNKVMGKILDGTPAQALRDLQAGLMSGVTSPSRPWFRLTHPDPQFKEDTEVKEWLYDCENQIQTQMLKTNVYKCLPKVYGQSAQFATGCMYFEEDFEEVLRFTDFNVGSYYLANDEKGRPCVFAREFSMTVRQIVRMFGKTEGVKGIDWSKFSSYVKNCYEKKQLEAMVWVAHIIQPNQDYNDDRPESKFKRYASCYFETTGDSKRVEEESKFLSEKGYDDFPVLVFRWETDTGDAYGTDCPGMLALADVKQIQVGEKMSLKAINKGVDPPLIGAAHLKSVTISGLPGEISYVDERDGLKGLRPLHEVSLSIKDLEGKQEQKRRQVKEFYYSDVIRLMLSSDRREITAREVAELSGEKISILTPVMEQMNQEFLDPLIVTFFRSMLRQGLLPPPPPQIQGTVLKVQYISIFAQALRSLGIDGVERITGFAIRLAAAAPSVLDKFDTDKVLEEYADLLSAPPGFIRADDAVQQIRQAQAKAAQAQAQMNMLEKAGGAMKDFSAAQATGGGQVQQMMQGAQAGSLQPA